MTTLSDPPTVDGSPDSGKRRTRWVVGSVAAVLVVLLATWTAWTVLVERVADDVFAEWSLDCPLTKVGTYEGDPAIHSRPGWRCEVVVTVHNRADRSVQVGRLEGPLLGHGGGAEIQGFSTDDAEFSDAGEMDGVWTVDIEVPAGESRTFTVGIGWRQRGCNSAGHLHIDDWPTVEMEALHRTFEYEPEQRLVLRTFDDRHDRGNCVT